MRRTTLILAGVISILAGCSQQSPVGSDTTDPEESDLSAPGQETGSGRFHLSSIRYRVSSIQKRLLDSAALLIEQ